MKITKTEMAQLRKLFKQARQLDTFKATVEIYVEHYLVWENKNVWGLEDPKIVEKVKIPKTVEQNLARIYSQIHKICVQIAKNNSDASNTVYPGQVKEYITYHGKKLEVG